MAEFIKLYEQNPERDKIHFIAEVLSKGGLVIYPTDTVYGLGCDLLNQKAIDKVLKIKGSKPKSINLSFICYDLSHISEYAKGIDTPTFKLMKRLLPGPYTFLLNSSSRVPKILNVKKKTVGIRVPDNHIPRLIVRELGHPILNTSIHEEDQIVDYATDPSLIYEKFEHFVDVVIDGGPGHVTPSTIIDYTNQHPEILREGLGKVDFV